MSEVRLFDVSKSWGDVVAVDKVGFTAMKGEFVVILGPSGCGKSTTLRMIAGLEPVSAGRIHIDGKDVTDLPPSKRRVSMVFQSYALFPHLNVAENIVFGLKVRRVARVERDERLRRVADLLGLGSYLNRKPSQLSGGQRQRVALGRAIIAESPVCLMDEPLSNLDAKLRQEMRSEIRGLQKRLGITMIYVTHDQTEAMSMANKIVLMHDGRVEQVGPPDELYSRPATIFAAGFIGTPPMNLLRCESEAGTVTIPGMPSKPLDGMPSLFVFGVRPEDLHIDPSGPLRSKIIATEYHGSETLLTCQVGNQTLNLRVSGRPRNAVGEDVSLSWTDSAVHIFDPNDPHRRDDLMMKFRKLTAQ